MIVESVQTNGRINQLTEFYRPKKSERNNDEVVALSVGSGAGA